MELTIQEYSQTAAALNDLRDRYAKVVFPVETTTGMKDATQARKELRDIRVGLEKMRQKIKAPALERCKLIDEEAKAITSALRELEDPIDEQIKSEELRKEREKQEREKRERERVAAIRAKIERIARLPSESMNDSSDELNETITGLQNFEPGEDFAEFAEEARKEADKVYAVLTAMRDRRVEQEREAARLEAERAEFERLRAEAAERQRIEDERRQAEQARLDAERAEADAKLAAERAEIEAQRAELEKMKAEAVRAEQDRQEAIARAEQDRVERERVEREQKEAEAEIARIEAEQEAARIEAERVAEHVAQEEENQAFFDAKHPSGAPVYSKTTFKDNGEPIMLNEDGTRSVFCDLNDDEPLPPELARHEVTEGPFVFDSKTSRPDVSIVIETIAGHFGCSDDEAKNIITMAAAEIISQRSEAA